MYYFLIAAGGILHGEDIAKAIQMGAKGVQMGTRLVASHECDAHPAFKQMYLDCNEGDVKNGLVFAGARVHEIKEMFSVQAIMDTLMKEYVLAT
jgi:nitronate monooxygenase